MITIIHGDDITSSRNYLQEEKQKNKDSVFFEGKKITATDLFQNIQGSGLFTSTKTIFIEGFLIGTKKTSKDTKEIIDFILKNHKESKFFLWEPKEFSKRELFVFKEAIVKNFKLPQSIFVFLDSLRPNNFKNIIQLFHQTLESEVKEELIFFMLQRQFRFLLALSDDGSDQAIDELIRLAQWKKGKLERQAGLFSQAQLKRIYSSIYKIESGLKTGKLNLTLSQAIDFLLFEI